MIARRGQNEPLHAEVESLLENFDRLDVGSIAVPFAVNVLAAIDQRRLQADGDSDCSAAQVAVAFCLLRRTSATVGHVITSRRRRRCASDKETC